MRFTVDTAVLKSAIEVASHATASTNMTPILENLLLSVQYKRVVITGNNMEMAIEYVIDTGVEIESEGSYTVSSKFLVPFVSLLSDERITISLGSGGALEFVTPTSETRFKGTDASKFPVIPGFKAENPFEIDAAQLKKAVEHTLFSTAEGNVRPTLAGIHLKINADGSAAFASTDSFRLSEFVLKKAVAGAADSPGIIIPAKTATELSRILTEDGKVELFVSENQLLVTYGNIKLFSRLLNGHFPDYRNFFPKKFATRGVVLRADLVQALRRMNLISKENNYNTKVAFRSSAGLEISTGDTEIGAGRGNVPASVEGEDGTIGLNSTYLLETLSVIKDDYVSIDFETSLSPVMVRGVPAETDTQSFRHIIMPLKI
jgi:DNA polymerase-3 subunit beta